MNTQKKLADLLQDVRTATTSTQHTEQGQFFLACAVSLVNLGCYDALRELGNGPHAWILTHPFYHDALRCRRMVELLSGGGCQRGGGSRSASCSRRGGPV